MTDDPRNRSIPEIRTDILTRLDRSDMTVPEICAALPDDGWIVERVVERMAAAGLIRIAPGTNGKKWTTKAKALRQEAADDAE